MKNEFLISNYIATNHWATCKNNFKSILNIFNYYGYAFKNYSKKETDADLHIHLFDENGKKQLTKIMFIETGHSLHVEINELLPNFQGIVSSQLVPKGRMKRLSNKINRPISTSYFMMYKRHDIFCDFSHELFPLKLKQNNKDLEWMTILYMSKYLQPGFVVMNSLYNNNTNIKNTINIELKDLSNKKIFFSKKIVLNSMGSKFINLVDLLDIDKFLDNKDSISFTAIVKGQNIEQPMSIHLHESGDFNIHHF